MKSKASLRITKPGTYSLSEAAYRRDPCPQPSLNASVLKVLLAESPAHAKALHPRLAPSPPPGDSKTAFDLGRAAHTLLLGKGAELAVVDADDWRSKSAREERAAAIADGHIPLLAAQAKEVGTMVKACRKQLAANPPNARAFEFGDPEQTLIWRETVGKRQVWCRARLDWLPRERGAPVYDYKTTSGSAAPEAVQRHIYNYSHDIQAAFYLRGLKAVYCMEPDFRFVFQEASPPYAVSVAQLDRHALSAADKKVEAGLDLWSRCLAAKTWPSHPPVTCYVGAPAWDATRWAERVAREEFHGDILALAAQAQAPL